jgi:hypothetical protein
LFVWEKELRIFKYLTLEVLVDLFLKCHELLLLRSKITKSWGTKSIKMEHLPCCESSDIMNAWNERGSDSENFGKRITEFEVTIAKIWQKEVIGTYL